MKIGTNRMCIITDDNCVNTTTTADNCKKTLYDDLLSLLSWTRVIRVVLSVSYLLTSYFVMNFLRRIISVCHNFRSMCRSGRMKSFESCFKVEDQGAWRRQNLHAAILRRGWMFGNRGQKACTKTRNAGMPERRNTKTRNTKLLKPGTHENNRN